MTKHSKAYRKAAELIDPAKTYEPLEAAKIAKQTSPTKFDGTVEVAQEQLNLLLIRVSYRVRATNTMENMVYPFYITEGQ